MNLSRDGNPVDEATYTRTTPAMHKMQEITDRLAINTPDLNKHINQESILKPQKIFGQEQILIHPNKKNELLESNRKKKNPTIFPQTQTLKNEMTVVDWQKRCNEITSSLVKEKEKNQTLTQDINNRQERFVKREIEYRKIIEELQSELRSKSSLDVNDKKIMEPIFNLHSEIIGKINKIYTNTSKVMIDQERDIMRFFINKINEIKKEYEEERIRKGKKDQDYLEKENQLISELEWIKNIAQKIDQENHSLMKKYMDLKAQYQTQENDREMLLKELIMKKKKNAILKSQIEQYEKLLNEVTKEDEEEKKNGNSINFDSINELKGTSKFGFNALKNKKNATNLKADNLKSKTTDNFGNIKFKMNENSEILEPGNQQEKSTRYESTIKTLQNTLRKEQKRVRELKSLYIKEIESKNEMEKILRKCIDDIKDEMLKIKAESRLASLKQNSKENTFAKEQRESLIEKLLNNEKVLTIIYDKTFYSKNDGEAVDLPDIEEKSASKLDG